MKWYILPLLGVLCSMLACNYPVSPPPAVSSMPAALGSLAPPTARQPLVTLASEQTPQNRLPTPAAGDLVVVYVKDGNLWLWSQGRSRQLTARGEAHRPRISSDGKVIAYLQPADDFHLEIWAVDANGQNERRLVNVADLDAIGGGFRDPSALALNPYRFLWLPGTHNLAYNTHQVFQGPGLSLLNDLNLVQADTLQKTNLMLSGWGGEFVYAPDGKQIAISQPDKIILAQADGSEYRPIFNYSAVTTYSEYRYYAAPVWAKDGQSLFLALPPDDPLAMPAQPTVLWRIPLDATAPLQIGSVLAVPFFEQPVEFSPDATRIAFLREVGQPAENLRELHLAASDGAGDWVYARGASVRFQGWSPDARRFAYTLGLGQELWLGSLQETPLLLGDGFSAVQDLRWIDGERLLFWQANGGSFELKLANLTGGMLLIDSIVGAPEYDFAD